MERRPSGDPWPEAAGHATQAGITLVEVLVAIFIMGVGLLALLTLFPLGALQMAEAIKDDRTAAVAAEAAVLSAAGQTLLSQTFDFVEVSRSKGSVDPDMAAHLREEYEHFQLRAADLEARLEELQRVFPHQQIQHHLGPLLAQIRSIKLRVIPVIQLLLLLECGLSCHGAAVLHHPQDIRRGLNA